MAKPLTGMSDAELLNLISKASSDDEIQKILLNSGRNLSDVQALNSDILGSLIENRFGTEDVKSSAALNDYLGKIKQKDYPALDEVRKLLYPDAKPISASYEKGLFNNGTFYSNPTMDAPIRLGSTPLTNDDYTNARAKRVLSHELSHGNDLAAIHLKRLEKADPEKYRQLVERIGNINSGGEDFLQHSKNIADKYPTAKADFLTPEKVDILDKIIREQEPSVTREKHTELLNKYKKALLMDIEKSPDKMLMQKYMGVDYKKIPSITGEALEFEPSREYVTKALESEYDPVKAESIRSQGHHATRLDIPDDIGHQEARNIKRLSKGLGLLGVSSPLGAMVESIKDLYKEAPVKANPTAQSKIAEAYEAMKHDPTNPEVQKAYNALINETEQQYEDLQKNKNLKISKIGPDYENPYKSSKDLINDVKQNKHMAYFPTESGFGAGNAADAVQNNPLLRETRFIGPDGKPMLANDLFRIVHDYYGHVEGENKFGPTGEERAYQNHKKMYSPEASKALATETRGQNSWVNFGPYGEENRANPSNTKYAEQKTGLLPSWATEDLQKIENPKLSRLHAISTVAAKALAPLAVTSSIVPLVADIKEGKPNTALARAVSYAAPMGAEELTDKLMQTAELRDTSPELQDPEYRKLLMRIGKKRMEQGKSPIIKSFSGREVDTSKTEDSEFLNRIKALQDLKSQG